MPENAFQAPLSPLCSDVFVGIGLGSAETLLHFCTSASHSEHAPRYKGAGPFSMFIDFSAVYLDECTDANAIHHVGNGSTAEVRR